MSWKKELLVDIQWLKWWYPKTPSMIFDNFQFKLHKWDFCFVLWKSWVWKTTLVKFLIWQIKPPKKMVFYRKEDMSRFSSWEIQRYRRKIWVVFQDYKLIDWKSVNDNILYPTQLIRQDAQKLEKKLNNILFKIKMMDKKDTLIPYLSGWEKQRVAIARALISNPEFIIADEPTWNLDGESSKEIIDILLELNRAWNTIVCITHNLQLINYAREINSELKVFTLKK